MKFRYILLLLFSVLGVDGLNILGVLPLGSKSHFAIGKSILDALYDKGHNITVISPFPQKKTKERYKDVDLSEVTKKFEEENSSNALDLGKLPVFAILFHVATMNEKVIDSINMDNNYQEFLKNNEKFDICVIEVFYMDALLGLADHFDCVLISYTTFNAVGIVDQMTGNISPPSFVPMPFLDYTDKMTFMERLWNTIYTEYEKLLFHVIQFPLHRKIFEKYFPNSKKSIDELFKSSAIIFQNSHVSFATPRSYLPNVIEICGIHVKPAQPLSNDLQSFLDNANEGAILFSMGSFIKSKDFPVDKRDAFVRAFRKLKQKVIWKYEDDLPDNPENLKTVSWLPQRDILAHKNIVLFITHGGLLGTTEAMYEGVPLLGIPIYGDQAMNMRKAVSRNYGLVLNFDEISEEKISNLLDQLLNDSKYRETARVLSKRFTDRPMSPQESVVYWTEYAYRHKGAKHLRSQAAELNYIQLFSVDVYVVLLIIFVISILINFYVAKFILKKLAYKLIGKKEKKN